jgi:diguanylate cyclase (GGDEF)-like protein/PAS domain S-box-containing protein
VKAAWFSDAPIGRKLLLVGLLTSGIALFSVSLVLSVRGAVELSDHTLTDMKTYAKVTGNTIASAMLFDDRKTATEMLASLSANPDVVDAILYDTDGEVFARYSVPNHPSDMPFVRQGSHQFSWRQLIVSEPIQFGGDTLGSIYLESDLHSLYDGLLRDIVLTFLAAGIVFLLVTLLYSRLQQAIVAPVVALADAMQEVSSGQDYGIRVSAASRDEVGKLAHAFNAMLERIQSRDAELAKHRERLEEVVAQRTASLTAAQRIAHLGNWEWDIAANTLQWSDEMCHIFDVEPHELSKTYEAFLQMVHPDDSPAVDEAVRIALEQDKPYSIDYRIRRPDGTERHVHAQGEVQRDAEAHPLRMMGTVQDVTERKQAEEEINNLAYYDVLTGLPNRRLFMDRFRVALSHSARNKHYGALLFLDLDKFKTINDSLGHAYGDLLLVEVAQRIRHCVREADTVARLGGDEFAVLIEELGTKENAAMRKVALFADKIRAVLATPYLIKESEYRSSSSLGVCLYLGSGEPMEALLKHADIAMYQAKSAGRNAVRFFDPFMQQMAEQRAALETDLQCAVSDGQLRLYYQVQVDSDKRPIGAEALVRWLHPQRGIVSPAQFIPVAEESSLILEIGHWVMDNACRRLAQWAAHEDLKDLTLSVNVSAQQFRLHDFVDRVTALVHMHGINPARLKLELTESVVLSDVADVVAKMRSLKTLGVLLSMDDFGTGYSSLSYLKQLPLDQIKIDQSFVRDVVNDQNDAVMVQTIIDMARNFRLHVIAEGVENEEQFTFLREHGCAAYQGYLLSKPVPIEEFETLFDKMRVQSGA